MALARALRAGGEDEPDVSWLLSTPARDLLQAAEHKGLRAYRLFHQALADHLKRRASLSSAEVQRRFTVTLQASVPRRTDGSRDWLAAHPYVAVHLAIHAAECGQLDGLLEDPGYLIAAEPDQLLRVLPAGTTPRRRAAERLYRQFGSRLRSAAPGERATLLELAARQRGADSLAELFWGLPLERPWSVRWAHRHGGNEHRILGVHDRPVNAVATGRLASRPVVVSGGDDGQVRIWDLESGAQVGSPLAADPYCVASVAVAELAGRPVIVSGGETGVIRRWDLADGRLVGSDIRAHYAVVRTLAVRDLAIGVSDGDPVIVSAGFEDGAVRVWGLESGELIREHRFGLDDQDRPRKIYSVLTTVIKNRPVIVASGEGGIRTWYLDDGSPYRELATNSRFDIISTVAATIVDGHEMILYGDHHGHINHWDPIGGEIDVLGENSNAFSTALAIADLSGVALVVTAWYFGSDSGRLIRVWDIRTKALMGTLSGHESEVLALAVDRIGGRSTILSGGTDRTVRVWDLASDLREEEPVSPEPLDAGLAVGRVGGRDVVAYGDRQGGMRLWQLADGTPVRRPSKFHRKFLALGSVGHRAIAVSPGSNDRELQAWDLFDAVPIGDPLPANKGGFSRYVAIGDFQGEPVVAFVQPCSGRRTPQSLVCEELCVLGCCLSYGHCGADLSLLP